MAKNDTPSGMAPHKWPDEMLEKKRLKADPLGDETVAAIINSGHEKEVNNVFYCLVQNDTPTGDAFKDLPPKVEKIVTSYFEQTKVLPKWMDRSKIAKGERLFSLFGPEISMLLNVKSLPLCYACRKGAKVLCMTGRLTERSGSIDPLARRLMETAQMIINAMSPGGMSDKGKGIVTIQKVRLIHASIRYFLKNKKYNQAGWDVGEYGEPINQEDMAGTLMSFSALILNGLDQLGIQLKDDQIEAYMHCWNVIGYLMGIDEDLLPANYKEGWNLGISIMKHQAEDSEDCKELTRACIDFLKYVTPGNWFDEVPEYMIWYFVEDIADATGKDLRKILGLEVDVNTCKDRIVLKLLQSIFKDTDELDEHSKVVQRISGVFNKIMLTGFLHHYNEHKKVHFYIPPSLQKDWKLTPEWMNKWPLTPDFYGNRIVWQKANYNGIKNTG